MSFVRLSLLLLHLATVSMFHVQTIAPARRSPDVSTFRDSGSGRAVFISQHTRMYPQQLRSTRGICSLKAEQETSQPKKRNSPLPVVLGPMGGSPLLPGGLERLSLPSPGQIKALEIATTFASLDATFASRPLVAFLAQGPDPSSSNLKGIATLATIEDVQTDDEGKIRSATVAGVGRAVVQKVRMVNQTLIVADVWWKLQDEIPHSSYMHALEALRVVADQASNEHNKRRTLISSVTAKAAELQLCDLQGVCNTEALLELGPGVYSKAMELAAAASAAAKGGGTSAREKQSISHVLSSLESMTEASLARSKPWDDLWPEWGDEIDAEMRTLRAISFSAWRALQGVCDRSDMERAMCSVNSLDRLKEAKERLYQHRMQLQEAEKVLVALEKKVAESSRKES